MILSLLQLSLKIHSSSHRSPYDYLPCWYPYWLLIEIAYAHSLHLILIHPPENEWHTNLADTRTESLRSARMTTWVKYDAIKWRKEANDIHLNKNIHKHPWVARSRMISASLDYIEPLWFHNITLCPKNERISLGNTSWYSTTTLAILSLQNKHKIWRSNVSWLSVCRRSMYESNPGLESEVRIRS